MRTVFVGTAAFAVPSLDALVQAGYDVPLVVTQPDRPGGRGLKLMPSPVKARASELGLSVYQPERIRNEEPQAHIRTLGAELMVVVAYGQILPASLLDAPHLGTLNVHASLLPRHRGAAPIEWAILSGDQATGVTIMRMDPGVDTGPILSQDRTAIGPGETAAQLDARLAELGARLLVRTLPGYVTGTVQPVPQAVAGATYAPRLKSEDGKLDPSSMTAEELDRRVRALSERVGTWMRIKDVELKVLRGHPDAASADAVPIETKSGTYVVEEVQPPGGRRMSAAAWLRGRH